MHSYSRGMPQPYPPRRGNSGIGFALLAIGGGVLALGFLGLLIIGAVVFARMSREGQAPQARGPQFLHEQSRVSGDPEARVNSSTSRSMSPAPPPAINSTTLPRTGDANAAPTRPPTTRPPTRRSNRPRAPDLTTFPQASAPQDQKLGPDGNKEEVYSAGFRGEGVPPNSRPPTRVTDINEGAEVWVQWRGRSWYRSTVLSTSGLRAVVHFHGHPDSDDEEVAITKIRLTTDVHSPTDFASSDTATNPFEQALPSKRRTWTDNTGKFKLEAEFVKLASGRLTLKRADGTEITMTLDKLSDEDQKIARQLAEL